jgi:hypothetical protein
VHYTKLKSLTHILFALHTNRSVLFLVASSIIQVCVERTRIGHILQLQCTNMREGKLIIALETIKLPARTTHFPATTIILPFLSMYKILLGAVQYV